MTWHLIPLRAATLLDNSADQIRHGLNRVDVWQRAAGSLGLRLTRAASESATWTDGEIIRLDPVHLSSAPGSHRVRPAVSQALLGSGAWIGQIDIINSLPVLTIRTGSAAGARIQCVLGPTAAGTVVTAELISTQDSTSLRHRMAALVQAPRRRSAILALRTLLGILTLAMHENVVVVGAAIIRDGKVLAARRTYPAVHAGKWELPGGKVEPGESDSEALTREVGEELGIAILVGEQIGPDIALGVEMVLRIYAATADSGEPISTEHDSLLWVGAEELSQLDWLDGDRALLEYLTLALTQRPPANRAKSQSIPSYLGAESQLD